MTNLAIAQAEAFEISSGTAVLQFASLSFDASVSEWTTTLISGGKLVVSGRDVVLAGEELSELIKLEQVEVATIPPSVLPSVNPAEIEVLRTLVVAGEACPQTLVEQWAGERRMLDAYGPTETTVCATISGPLNRDDPPLIGRAMANMRVYVKDQGGHPAPICVGGELCIGGTGIGRGYLSMPDVTAERYVPDELSDQEGARMYRTGDRGRWINSGQIEYLGRLDYQVKLRGHRIELAEIEAVLSRHPQVQQAVVVLREDDPGKKRLVSYVSGAEKIEDEDIRQHLRVCLPDFMVPSVFVQLERMPLTTSGKVDRSALPRPETTGEKRRYVPPRNDVEEELCEIWSGLLRVEQVGINDNFFELGGDSILSIQAIARARAVGIHLTARQFFEHQTIAGLAEVAERAVPGAEQELLAGPVALTPIQHLFFEWSPTNPHYYNQAVMLGLKPHIDSVLLDQAVSALVVHHDCLRLRFERRDGMWIQSYGDPPKEIPFARRDMSSLDSTEQAAALREDVIRVQSGLCLDDGVLLRAVEYELGAAGRRLLLVIHHLAVDGVSWRILLEDLQRAYEQMEREEPVQLPPKTTSYRRWSERLKEYASLPEFKREAEYWLSEDWDQAAACMPMDGEVGESTAASARNVVVWLTVEETDSLLLDVPAAYRTQINEVLLTALMQAINRWSGARSLLIEMEGHGREDVFEDVDLSRTVGWFTTVFPVRLSLESDHPGEALKRIKESMRAIPNRGLGYGVLRYLGDDEEQRARLNRRPRPQIGFNYLGQFDQVVHESPLFNPVREDSGPTRPGDNRRPHLLEVHGKIVSGQLSMSFTYSENIHSRETIEKLAGYYSECLRRLITHCCSSSAGGYTPSDFPDANLTQEELDGIMSRLGKASQRSQSSRGSR
jgi:non-ribosomal peptide synthase protein (TIGR01720 family)